MLWGALGAWPYAALVLLLGALYLPWIGSIPLDGTLEGNRLEAAREMLHSGDWLVPRLGGSVYLAKPPLHPWTLALGAWPFGDVSLAGGRAVSAVAAILLCALVFAWGRRELGRRAGAFAAFALGGSVLLAEKAVRAELETELALATTLALFALFDASRAHTRGRRWTLRAVSGLALGAALLVKGPPALIVFLAATLAACLPLAGRRGMLVSALAALALGSACALAWVVPVCARLGFESAWSAFNDQFLERIVSAGRTNAEAFWFYPPALCVGLLPASLLLPCLALVGPARAGVGERARARATFLWGWALVSLVAFSVSSGKETRYLLPMLPAWSLLLAWGWCRARNTARFVRWRRGLARALAFASWVAPALWLVAGALAFPTARPLVASTALAALLARVVFAWSVRVARPAALLGALLLAVLGAKIAWAGTFLERQRRAIPVESVARALAARLQPGEEWILLGPYRSWWHFSVNRPCFAAKDWAELRARVAQRGPSFVLAPQGQLGADAGAIEILERWMVDGEDYVVFRLPS